MRCIVYLSLETRRMARADILDILRVSRVNNTVREVTGMLMYYDGVFLQVLEGDAERIEALMTVLRHDRRHRDMRVLLDEPIAQRHFAEWSMALVDLADLPADDRWLCRHLDRPLPDHQSTQLAHRIHRLIGSFQAMVRNNPAVSAI